MRTFLKFLVPAAAVMSILISCKQADTTAPLTPSALSDVHIADYFWAPRIQQWSTTTTNYLFDKFEGKDVPENIASEWAYTDAFRNFDRVAAGERDCGEHAGYPWYDGLIYEMIRAAADFQQQKPDAQIQERIDGYIKRIAAAQEENGYLNTYTQLVENGHRWGENGGKLRWQHDLYNAGALVDAGVHYFNATGKRELLDVAIKIADLICDYIGWAPKHDIVPGHALPEEAFVSLYELTGEQKYLDMTRFWIDARGTSHPGLDSDYAQDRVPVRELQALEGHAVRASLLMDGVTDYTRVSGDTTYTATCKRLWDNMVGRKMLLTGAIGSVAYDEGFGEDYFLPVDSYAETCAGVGLAFYSHQMHLLDIDGKYMDELERALYNNVLGGIGFSGTEFTYINPLNATNAGRWGWHSCPCCPPMFLKLMSALPSMIYSTAGKDIYVNLYIGNKATVGENVGLTMSDGYTRDGKVLIDLNPAKAGKFSVKLRIPGWARSCENPYGLYSSSVDGAVVIKVNGKVVDASVDYGYATVRRRWKAGDTIEISFPIEPRYVTANEKTGMEGMSAIALGPFVYCLEDTDNPDLEVVRIGGAMKAAYRPDVLGGVQVVTGDGFTAIPCYSFGNRSAVSSYKIWNNNNN